jgi:dihydrofolate reductase
MKPFGGAWSGPQFMLTHHPEDAREVPGWTVLGGTLEEAIATAVEAANGKALEIHSANIASQAIDAGLVDEIHVHIAPVILGQGVRFFDRPGPGPQILLDRVGAARPSDEVDLIFTPRQVSG